MEDFNLNWEDLTIEEKEQATQSYRAIRAFEEEIDENDVDISYLQSCRFSREDDGYIVVLI